MIYFVSCNGYKTIDQRVEDNGHIPAHCAYLEEQRADGFGVFAQEHGHIIASSEGYSLPEPHTPDHATLTGMYDYY